jgi:high-affinity nickel-transport protein
VVFGGLSVLLYKPWRRRVDKKRLGNAHFEPLPQSTDAIGRNDEEQQSSSTTAGEGLKDVHVVVQSVEATDLAGPAQR